MPCLNIPITSGGPLIDVFIGVSKPRNDAMKLAGITPPQVVSGRFLIDTGASATCVDPNLVASLGLPVIASVQIHTPSTQGAQHFCQQYDALLYIPGPPSALGFLVESMPLLETHLQSQGIDGLIGRDVIDKCTLIYNGTAGIYTLAY